jgi:hypothetical protein
MYILGAVWHHGLKDENNRPNVVENQNPDATKAQGILIFVSPTA